MKVEYSNLKENQLAVLCTSYSVYNASQEQFIFMTGSIVVPFPKCLTVEDD